MLPRKWNSTSPLTFPSGIRPGYDSGHMAAGPVTRMSCIASTGGFTDLYTGKVASISNASNVTQKVDVFGNATNVTSTGFATIASTPTTTTQTCTMAAILSFNATAGSFQIFVRDGTGGGAWAITLKSGSFELANNLADNTSSFAAVANVPYFFAASGIVSGGTTVNYVLVRLDNGSTKTQTVTSAGTAAASSGSVIVGNNSSGTLPSNARIAAAMFSTAFLTLPQLLQWAQNPWDFWYPPTAQNVIFSSLSTAVSTQPLPTGKQYYDQPGNYRLQEDWRRGWEHRNVRYIGLDRLVTGKQEYNLAPGQIPENWRKSWEHRNVRYIGQDRLVTGKQSYDNPVLRSEDWRRGWEFSKVLFYAQNLPPGKQYYLIPVRAESWNKEWSQSLVNLYSQRPFNQTDWPVFVVQDKQNRFFSVNLLENTLTPVIDIHFKPLHMTVGRLGNLGGLS